MSTHLNTLMTDHGVELSNDDGVVQSIIVYQFDPTVYQVTSPDGELLGPGWATREAADFYALALYADAVTIQDRAGS